MSRLQAPVHYAVQTSPTRAGSYPAPYTIINPNATGATVWIADNAGLQSGQGTPVYPGTSIQWNKDGDLWAVAEAAGTQIIISYDVTDWQPNPAAIAAAILNSGVLIVDDPVALVPNNTVLTSGQQITADISKYQSLVLAAAGRAGNTTSSELRIRYPSTGMVKRISMKANTLGWSGVLPLLGDDLEITAVNGDVTINNAVISHRQYVNSYQQIFGAAPTFYLVKNTLFVANGAAVALPAIRPFFGDIDIRAYAVLSGVPATTGSTRLTISDGNGDEIWTLPFEHPFASPSTIMYAEKRIPNQGDQWGGFIFNGLSAPVTMTVEVHINPVESIVG